MTSAEIPENIDQLLEDDLRVITEEDILDAERNVAYGVRCGECGHIVYDLAEPDLCYPCYDELRADHDATMAEVDRLWRTR